LVKKGILAGEMQAFLGEAVASGGRSHSTGWRIFKRAYRLRLDVVAKIEKS
jgi:hypothetical protein